LARYDQLTGLSNRSDFLERLRSDILLQGDEGNSIALLYVDLDRFKAINDTLGHSVGDEVLRETARRITRCLDTMSYAARLGGDEFAIALHCEDGQKQAEAVCSELIHVLKLPFEVGGHQLSFGASIGIAMSEGVHEGPEQVIHNADLALYRAKSSGRGSYKVFETNMDLAMRERRELETQLRSATANKEFTLHYQPIVDVPSGKIIGYESLIRWNNPQLGQVEPDRFIPIAEESGLIHDIGDWVINQACRDAKGWKGQQKVAINLSGNQLRSYRIVQRVIAALAETGLPPHRLELEVTESVLLGDSETTMGLLENLRSLGVKISLDDFGTGYSSLAYLVQFPFDKIKIDKSFVQAAGENGESLAIVRSILSLAKALKMTTLAEGIETQEQLSLLQKEGCEQVQGYFLGKPMPLSELAPDSQNRRLKVA